MVNKTRHLEVPSNVIKCREILSDGITNPRTEYICFEFNVTSKLPAIKVWTEVNSREEGKNYCYTRLVRESMKEYYHKYMLLKNLQTGMEEVA